MSVLAEASVEQIEKEDVVMNHKGQDISFINDSADVTYSRLMLASNEDKGYRAGNYTSILLA